VAAWAAVAGVALALIVFWAGARRSRFQSGVEILLQFNDQFDSERIRNVRKTAAEAIKEIRLSNGGDMKNTDDVLDFFETVSFLVRKKAIDRVFVWHSFYYWLHRYYLLCQSYIEATRKKDNARWQDLCWLHPRLNRIERSRGGQNNDVGVSKEDLDEFIEEERSE
jgi:hypothetical protein